MTSYALIFRLLGPEAFLTGGALAALGIDLGILRGQPAAIRRLVMAAIASMACLSAVFWIWNMPENEIVSNGMLVINPLTQLVKAALLVLSVCSILISVDSDFTDHIGEYFALLLLSTAGMTIMISSEDLLLIFVALELTSLPLYILTAFREDSIQSAEAALKYFLFGSIAAAFALFGLSLIYGVSGSTSLTAIATAVAGQSSDPMLIAGLVMLIIGFGFKIAVVPFHLWAPDVYQGAPSPAAAFIASGSKLASFFIFAKILFLALAPATGSAGWSGAAAGWAPVLAIAATFSMLIGNIGAIAQTSVKRLLAYSAIAHSGYALLGFFASKDAALSAIVYYAATYGITVIGAFGVVLAVERDGDATLADFAGLYRRSPLVSFCMMIFVLSLAGIPPLAGFFGKFYLFSSALSNGPKGMGVFWLVLVALAFSTISLYYYVQILKQVYAREPATEAPLQIGPVVQTVLVLMALAVLLLGLVPNVLVGKLTAALATLGH